MKQLRSAIVSGRYGAGNRIPTRKELCDTMNISTITLQDALDQLTGEGFIVSRNRQGTFVSDTPPHLSCYAVVFWSNPRLTGEHLLYPRTLATAARILKQVHGHNIEEFYGIDQHADSEDYKRLLDLVVTHRVAGVVFANNPGMLTQTDFMKHVDVPMVALTAGGAWSFPHSLTVGLDAKAWQVKAVKHLAAQGRRRVAVVGLGGDEGVHSVLLEQLAAHGIVSPPQWYQVASPHRVGSARGIVHLLFSLPKKLRPDALLITDDNLVEEAAAGLLAAGVCVPQDVEIVALANFPLESPASLPMHRLGFDLVASLQASFDLIHRRRAGEETVSLERIEPIWEDEMKNISTDGPIEPAVVMAGDGVMAGGMN